MSNMISWFISLEQRIARMIPSKWLRIGRFGIVGVSGVVVNEGVLALLCFLFNKEHYQLWSIAAIELAILSNFILNSSWTWSDRPAASRKGRISRLLKFNAASGLVALVNWGTMVLLTKTLGIDPLISNLVGIAFASGVNFIVSHFWTFKKHEA